MNFCPTFKKKKLDKINKKKKKDDQKSLKHSPENLWQKDFV